MSWFYYFGRILVRMLLRLFTRWQVQGKENIPSQGPLLVVSNHINLADPPLLAVSLSRKVFFMAKEELFQSKFSSYFVSGFGAFPIHRGKIDRKALHQAKRVLAEGLALAMFPEGERSKTTKLQPGFPGSALVALQNKVPILPVGITGTERIKGITWLLRRPRLMVNIGAPFQLPAVNGKQSKRELTELTNLIMRRIADLLPMEYRGSDAEQRKKDGSKR